MSECVLLLIDSIFNDRKHDIVLMFTYVVPEKSPIDSTENGDKIVILNEKLFTITSVYPEAEIFLSCRRSPSREQKILNYMPNDHLDLVLGDTDYPNHTFSIDRNS